MQNLKLAFGALCLGFLLLISCNDPTDIGEGLLDVDPFDIQSTEDIDILASTIFTGPVQTFNEAINLQLVDYSLGQINDPIFGSYQSSVYFEFDVNGAITPEFAGKTLDSAIILLPFDGLNTYGGDVIGESFMVELNQIATQLDTLEERFSNDVVATSELLETISLVPSTDSVVVNIINSTETDELQPHLRIPVPADLAQAIFNAPDTVFSSNNDFQEFFPGLQLKVVGDQEGIFGLQLRTANLLPQMQFFFSDTIQRAYVFPVGNFATKFTTFDHDFTDSVVEDFVQQGRSGGDSLLFIQSLEGTDIQIEFGNLDEFQDIVVNKAELVFEADSLPGDNFDLYPITPQMLINEVTEDGETELIEDLIVLILRFGTTEGLSFFGGSPDEDRVYRMNISGHFQRMIDGDATNILRITPLNNQDEFTGLNRGNRANRTVIKGPGRASGRMRLILTYTRI